MNSIKNDEGFILLYKTLLFQRSCDHLGLSDLLKQDLTMHDAIFENFILRIKILRQVSGIK